MLHAKPRARTIRSAVTRPRLSLVPDTARAVRSAAMEDDKPGYDDWFDEPAPPTQEASRGGAGAYDDADDVWVLPGDEQRRARRSGDDIVVLGVVLTRTQVAILAAAVLAVFFGILAAA